MIYSEVDYIIIGQGLAGTFLSYYLLNAGKKILVIDDQKPGTASKIASGVINPVTGRRIVKTWLIDELLPFALNAYSEISEVIDAPLLSKCSVIDFHPTRQMKDVFDIRIAEEPQYLHKANSNVWNEYFNFYFGAGEIKPCLLADVNTLLQKWKEKLLSLNVFLKNTFNHNELGSFTDHIIYDNIKAKKIFFCDGIAGAENPYFSNLPFALNKGEALIASIPDLPAGNIYKKGISIVPWQNELFWVGSSYEWNYTNGQPTPAFKENMTRQLQSWLKLPFEITDHVSAIRPANVERRPFAGLHPQHNNIGILNGMGTKGCSLAPFFAKQLADLLINGTPVYAEADVQRFKKVLARKI